MMDWAELSTAGGRALVIHSSYRMAAAFFTSRRRAGPDTILRVREVSYYEEVRLAIECDCAFRGEESKSRIAGPGGRINPASKTPRVSPKSFRFIRVEPFTFRPANSPIQRQQSPYNQQFQRFNAIWWCEHGPLPYTLDKRTHV